MDKKNNNPTPIDEPMNYDPADAFASNEPHGVLPAYTLSKEEQAEQFKSIRDTRQENASEYGVFISAYREKRTLSGTVSGVDSDEKTAYWVIYYNDSITVRIPFVEAFAETPKDLAKESDNWQIIKRQRQMLTKSIGVNTPFFITGIITHPSGYTEATASRKAALNAIRRIYFGHNAARPLKVGMDVDAQILSPGSYAAYISAFGLDIRVDNHNLSHRYIKDIANDFSPGTKIRMRIMEIEEKEGGIPQIRLSALPCELEKMKIRANQLVKSRSNSGNIELCFRGIVISSRLEKDKVRGQSTVTAIYLEDCNLAAFARSFSKTVQSLHPGDRIIFCANGVTEQGYVHGKILKVIGNY